MSWLEKLIHRATPSQKKPGAKVASPPPISRAAERAALLTKEAWIAEQLAEVPIARVQVVTGVRPAHIIALENAGFQTLHDLQVKPRSPLMGATGDFVREWLDEYKRELGREYDQLRRSLPKAA